MTTLNFEETRKFLKDKVVSSVQMFDNDISPVKVVMNEDENTIYMEIGPHTYEFGPVDFNAYFSADGHLIICDLDDAARLVVYKRITSFDS